MKRIGRPLLLAALLAAGTATAQEKTTDPASCLAYTTMVDYLDRAFAESRVAAAELDNGNRVELYASRRGTWTLVELLPDGQSCVNAYGERMKVERTTGQLDARLDRS